MEENRNIDREIALEKKIKQLDNIIFKRGQSAQTVHMMTKSKICYDHSTKQAIGFEKPFYLKKARESKPKLYDGNTILKMDTIVIPDSDETLMHCEESRSKMLLKEQDPLVVKHRVNTKPINYVILNNDYNKRFVRQSDLYNEHAYWKATSVPALNPSHSSTTIKVEVPKELPKVSMVYTSLKELKRYLTGFDLVVKERTTATAITEGTWGFEHTKACFRDEIIPFIKELKDIFNNFNQYLVEELADVQKVFYQMEQAVEQHRLESRTFEVKMNQVLSENERLLAQAIDNDIVKTVVNLSLNEGCETVNECQRCLELKTELLNKKDFVDKETYDKLCKSFTTLEKHCITLEADSQLNQEIFQQENSVLNQNAPSFTQLFELSELRAQSQAKDTVIVKLKEQIKSLNGNVDDSTVKMDMDEIETLNIELEHRVTKLVAENEHLKQTYKQLYDSIKPKRVQSKEQCDALIKQVNIKSGEISDLNAKLQEQGLVIAALKNELRKLKGKALDKEATETHSVDPKVSKDNMEPITPKLLNKRTAHSSYIKHTQEEALVLRDIVEHVKANYPQDSLLESAFRYTKVIQDLLSHISRSCPSINNFGPQLVEVTPRKKDKKVRFAESLTSTENTKTDSTSNIVSNKRVLHSTGVRLSTSASGSQPSGNTRNDRILQTPSSNSKNKVEAHPRNVKSSLNKRNGKVKINQVLSENERLLAQAIDNDIVKTVVNLSVNDGCETVNECQKCLELKTELLNKKDFVDKETYDKLCKSFTTLEKHCITLEADSQLNQEIFQQENSVLNQNAPSFTQLFELSELRAQSQEKDTVIVKLKEQIKSLKGNVDDSKVKMDMDEIETLNIELEHRVTKLVTENEHLKQTYKQLYDSIKPKRVQSKEQCDALIKQVNIKSGEISDLNAKLQEQGLVIAALKNELRKLKGKALDNEDTVTHSVDPKVSKDNMEPITPKLLNKRTAHSSYIKHTQEEALVLRDIVEHVKANYPQDSLLESAFRYTKVIQDLLSHISRSCPSINNCGPQLIEVIPRKKDKKVRFAESLTSTENTKPDSTSNIVSNKRVLHSTGVRLSTSASGSQPSGNTRNDRILQTPSSNSKNKVEAHPRNVKSSLNKRNGTVKVNGSASVQNSKKQVNSDYVCVNSDDCMSSDNLCVSNSMNDVKFRAQSKKSKSKKDIWKPTGKVFTQIGYIWRPTGRTFTIVGNACPLTRITTTNEVPSRKPIVLKSESPKPVVKLVYSRKPRKNKNTESVSKTKVVQIVLWYLDSGCSKHMTGDRSQLTNFISKFLGTVKFGNDQVAKIMGYGDYQIGNVTISRVYYVEGLGHNLFSVGQFCDSNLEVAFRQHTCFIRNLEGVDLLTGSRGDNLYTLSLGNMMASSPICLLSKASKTKSWLWHRRLSHLNFGAINHLARHGLVRGLPKLKFEKDHLCSACALGKSSKKPHKPKSEDTNQEKLYLLHMDLCGPMRVASVNGKKYILIIVDDYSRFTWVKCLRSKDEAPAFIINFLKMIQVQLKETVRHIRTDNGTEFVNQTLHKYYEKISLCSIFLDAVAPEHAGITGSPSQTIVESRCNHLQVTLIPHSTQTPIISHDVEEDNHDIEVAHMGNDRVLRVINSRSSFDQSFISRINTFVPPFPSFENTSTNGRRVTPLENIFGALDRTSLNMTQPSEKPILLLSYGYRQEEGIDFEEFIHSGCKFSASNLFLAFAAHHDLVIFQYEVKTAFLIGNLREEVYV
ncbi:retrovirus-related pol polyprotein from transposon TNT 1-94 [Tanacetum coccineum]|uniref:Retrovirus-related pol polyprotein from transposon TNT 1-94 n=1 Tax=Tanacetum coccineum TaxID=301880 RepID=A0ABQ5AFY8_9ASTR